MAQRVIFDTDIGTDVDDAYALAFLVTGLWLFREYQKQRQDAWANENVL